MHYETDGFPARLKKIRQNCGYNQQQMADVLAIHRTTYTYYELGRTSPPREVLNKLVEIFNILLMGLVWVFNFTYFDIYDILYL